MYILTKAETVLSDDYPIYAGFVYIVDKRFTRCPVMGTVGSWKQYAGAKEIRRCDLWEHPGVKIGDMVYTSYYRI